MIAAAVDRLRGIFRPPDPRTPEELENDLAEELAFHLDGLEREALASGADPDSARAEARRRFGDPDRIRAACRRVALEERFMLQRVNAVLTVILLIAVVAMGVQLYLGQAQNARVLDRLEESLVALAQRTESEASAGSPGGASTASTTPAVYLDGDVERPGTYEIPAAGLSVQRLIAAAGGRAGGAEMTVSVHRAGSPVFHAQWGPGDAADSQDSALKPGDLVLVKRPSIAAAAPADAGAGRDGSAAPGGVKIKGPVMRNVGVSLDGGSKSLQSVMGSCGIGLADEHLESVDVVASVRRPRGDGGFDDLPAQWRGTAQVPENPRVVAGDFVEFSLTLRSPPASLSPDRVLELPGNVLLNTAQLLQDAIAKARSEAPGPAWPAGTAERLESDLAAVVARLKARGVEWPEKPTSRPVHASQKSPREVITFEGQVRSPGKLGGAGGVLRGISLERALQNAGGLDVPYYFRDSVQVRAVIRRPRGDGGQEVLEATWLGGDAPPNERMVFLADTVTFSLEAVSPPRTLTDTERLGMTAEELEGAAAFVQASLARAREREPRGEWPQGTTARLELDLAALIDRIKALGGTWPQAEAPKSGSATGEGTVPAALDLSALGSMTKEELQARLALVSKARTSPGLDAVTALRLKSEFDALIEALHGRE